MSNEFGITDTSYNYLINALLRYPQLEKVVVFGSRAKGNYKKGSDIDIAIQGKDCTPSLAASIRGYLNDEVPIPYFVDVIDYNSLQNPRLREHIDRVGKVLFLQPQSK